MILHDTPRTAIVSFCLIRYWQTAGTNHPTKVLELAELASRKQALVVVESTISYHGRAVPFEKLAVAVGGTFLLYVSLFVFRDLVVWWLVVVLIAIRKSSWASSV